ncbi:MAG: N-acetyl-gamma-glutamyl-phosphate reductase [Acidobacteriia bacterium]|nr:N-acetyl-gamma-glutamyl-phosphate reductase [Terriglobia bacterium]
MKSHPNQKTQGIHASVIGATGYSGMELARLLTRHPHVRRLSLFSSPVAHSAGGPHGTKGSHSTSHDPEFLVRKDTRLQVRPFDEAELVESNPDLVFFATPNEISHELIPRYMAQPFRMIDLSGSFRLHDASLYPRWYGFTHVAPDMLSRFVYGLAEDNAAAIARAQWVANPGCYATSVLLPLLPLMKDGWIDWSSPVICDSKSGVSGAGKQPTHNTHFCEVSDSFRAYSVFTHRHLPEIEQHLGLNAGDKLIFTPHLLPINRGILSTLYFKTRTLRTEEELRTHLVKGYEKAPFVRVFPAGELPQVKWVTHTNYCDIGVRAEENSTWVVMVSCLDNLVKGAAGQAVQNMNLMFNYAEQSGLE